MRSLIQYVKPNCSHRDSLSLFVEYCGANKVKVHRQFYIYREFQSFFLENNHNITKLNFRDVTNVIEFDEFTNLLHRLINEDDKQNYNKYFSNELSSVLSECAFNTDSNLNEKLIEKFLKLTNEVFCKFRYSIIDKKFYYDVQVYNKVNELFYSVPYNRDAHFDDFDTSSKPEIEPFVEKELYELRIFNVGQANCSALIKFIGKDEKDYKVIFVFDLGYQKRMGRNAKLDEMICKIDSNTVILISHYDSDHINNISNHLYLTTSKWIFPNYDGSGMKALKTFQMLLKVASKKTGTGTIYNFPTPYTLSSNISIHQYTGTGKGDPFQSTLMNSKCLVCKLSIGGKDILIPADALYEEYGDDLVLSDNKKYDYILVPHHCCKYISKSASNPSSRVSKFVDDHTVGFIMCGINHYGHANIDHLSWFRGSAFLFNGSRLYDNNNLVDIISAPKTPFFSIKFK